ncbi:RluA family pseudouridine synthase [Opitutales bacterium]|nr:RluA family pseudouridine synthase [Opitutales bacterium]MDC3284486.1 RluA family pseudouridine synthase [Opitutales bacterium]
MKDIFTCPDNQSGRVDKILADKYSDFSREFIKQSIEVGKISHIDGSLIVPKTKINSGDQLLVDLSRPKINALEPYKYDLSIIHEDDHILVVNKPTGMVVHPGDGTDNTTLVHALLNHCPNALSPIGAPLRPGIVHRLDKETSGIILVAKSELAHLSLAEQFAGRKTGKLYQAIVCGKVGKYGEFNQPIGRHPKVRVKMAVSEKGKSACTKWERLSSFGDEFSHVKCEILSGRTHQIRVHFSAAMHPLAGDVTYGYKQHKAKPVVFPRVMLHAWKLSIFHPGHKKQVSFTSPTPNDFDQCLGKLKALVGE